MMLDGRCYGIQKEKNLISSDWNIISNHCGEPRARGTQVL